MILKRNKHSKSYNKKVTGPSLFAKLLIAARDVLKTWFMGYLFILSDYFVHKFYTF